MREVTEEAKEMTEPSGQRRMTMNGTWTLESVTGLPLATLGKLMSLGH